MTTPTRVRGTTLLDLPTEVLELIVLSSLNCNLELVSRRFAAIFDSEWVRRNLIVALFAHDQPLDIPSEPATLHVNVPVYAQEALLQRPWLTLPRWRAAMQYYRRRSLEQHLKRWLAVHVPDAQPNWKVFYEVIRYDKENPRSSSLIYQYKAKDRSLFQIYNSWGDSPCHRVLEYTPGRPTRHHLYTMPVRRGEFRLPPRLLRGPWHRDKIDLLQELSHWLPRLETDKERLNVARYGLDDAIREACPSAVISLLGSYYFKSWFRLWQDEPEFPEFRKARHRRFDLELEDFPQTRCEECPTGLLPTVQRCVFLTPQQQNVETALYEAVDGRDPHLAWFRFMLEWGADTGGVDIRCIRSRVRQLRRDERSLGEKHGVGAKALSIIKHLPQNRRRVFCKTYLLKWKGVLLEQLHR